MSYSKSDFTALCESAKEYLQTELRSLSTGRANPQVLDGVFIEQYGSRTPVAHVASISTEDARTIRVAPWDKTVVRDIERAINEANLGVSVSADDAGLRVFFPTLTTETRERLVKTMKEKLEAARVKVRSAREEANKEIDTQAKEGAYGEDDRLSYRDDIQSDVDKANKDLEELFHKKESEVMGE